MKHIKTFIIKIDPRAFEYYDIEMEEFILRHGKYEVSVGKDSRNLILKKDLEI